MRKGACRTSKAVSSRREMTGKAIFLSLAAFVLVGALGFISRAAAPDPAAMKTLREADTARAAVVSAVNAPGAPLSARASAPVRALQARGSGAKAMLTSAPVSLAPATWTSDRVVDTTAVEDGKVLTGDEPVFMLDAAADSEPATTKLKEVEKVEEAEKPAPPSSELVSATTYAFTAATGVALENMSSGTTLLVGADSDDFASAVTPIGFEFWYDGVRQTLFSVNANGLMRLGVAAVSTAFSNGLATTTNQPQITPYWDDLWVANNGKVHYKVVGSAPNRKLVVEWNNEQIPRVAAATAGAGTFQAWLFESTGAIEFVYGSGIATNSANGGYSVGLGTSASSIASVTTLTNTVSYVTANNAQTDAIPSGTAYTFTPNTPTAAPGALSFTAVGLNTMTLNWADTNSNEFGYAIYRSVDGVNYDFIAQTAANATTYVATALASNTIWSWTVVAVTEGGQSAASSGSQATTTGTVSGTIPVGPTGTFTTIAAAVASINTNGLAGNVILELQSTYVSTVETFPLVINTLGSPSNTIEIRPAADATALSITSANTTATLDLNTGTNVTINGRAGGAGASQLTIANTATAGVALRLINGASRNTIQFCTIQGVNTATAGGVVLFSTSTGVTGNNNNTIDSCDVRDGATNPVNGITSIGTAGTAFLNTGNTISNSNIFNFFSATLATNGILVTTNTNLSNTGWTISNNRLFQTASRTYTTAATHRGILVSGGNGHTISGNTVGFATSAGTGTYTMTGTVATTLIAIQLQVGDGQNSITGNTVAGISLQTTTGSLNGIVVTAGSVNITGNTVGSGTGNGSLAVTDVTTSGAFLVGINLQGSAAGTLVVSGNTVGSLTAIGTGGTINPNINVVQVTGGALTFSGNLIGSTSTANSIQTTTAGTSATGQQIIGIFVAVTTPNTISGNTVANVTNFGTGTAHVIRAVQVQNSTVTTGAGAGNATISLNNVHDITGANANATTFGGVVGILHAGTSPFGASIDQNTVSAISATNSGAVATVPQGIGYTNSSNGTITRNKVCDIRNASTGVTATAPPMGVGILVQAALGSGVTVSNNMVSLGDSQSTNTQFVGIMNNFVTAGVRIYYNSVNITGTAGGGALPTYGFLRGDNTAAAAITTPVSVLNNIFNNARTGGTGKHYAIGNVNTVPATGWAGASNNNVLNSPVATTVGIWGLALDQTFGQWQTSSGGDGSSLTGVAVPFVGPCDLHLNFGVTPTPIESHGTPIAGLTIDYDNQIRPGPAGSTNGGASAPDIGADEFDGVPGCGSDSDCSDGNICTDDTCVAGACNHANNTASCPSDNNDCTDNVCSNGACYPHNTGTCEDNNPCTTGTTCSGGLCGTNNADPCTDSNPCTIGDSCSGGVCVPGSAPLPAAVQFCNSGSIVINDITPPTLATPYPSSITLTGMPSYICSTQVALNGLNHTFPNDVDMLLVGPAGQKFVMLSDVIGGTDWVNINYTLTDAAAALIPSSGTPVSGSFKPTNYDSTTDTFPAPAPAAPYQNPATAGTATFNSVYNGTNPNGTWSLYVTDDAGGDSGTIGGGWCVSITAVCGSDADCNDGNVCTDDACVNSQCTHTNNTVACDDSNACTTGDTCTGGLCIGGNPPNCDDGDVCTTDSCNPGTGLCDHVAVVCNDNNSCTDDACQSPTTGCVYTPNNANTCSDSNSCTQTDSCVDGTCVGTNPVNCDDANVCTTDACVPATGACTHANNTNTCDDGNACTTGDSCGPNPVDVFGEAWDGVSPPALPLGWTSTATGTGLAWTTVNTSSDSAPNSAFGFDGATVSDEVLVSPPIAIGSAVAKLSFRNRWTFEGTTSCFDGGALDIKIGAGAFTDIVTAGGSFTSGGYTGTVSIGFSNPLASRPAWCLASTGYPSYLTTRVNLPASAAGQTIVLRWHVGSDSSTGAAGQNIDTILVTDSVNQCNQSTPVDCNDNNPCTDDSCAPATGCAHTDNTNACDDGSVCTTGDVCGGGTCNGTAIVCNDGNVCTDDSCNPATGCVATDNVNPCDDGNACTSGDTCGGGSCQAGGPTVCNDGNGCTDDTCIPPTGCVYNPNSAPCNDGNPCTTGDTCGGGSCQAGGPTVCNDGNVCTDDSCDPATGCVYTNNTGPCDDGNACTNDICSNGVCGCTVASGACQGALTTYDSTDVPKAISATGANTVTSTLTVSGAGSYLYDLDVKTFITHTSTGQLQISIKSPHGTIVTLSSQNGGTNDNLFNGTIWNDSADPDSQVPYTNALNIVTDTVFTNLVPRATLTPEEPLGAFIGEDPNGPWTLTIADLTTGDGGNLANWSMALTTLAAPPASTTVAYPSLDVPKVIPTTVATVTSALTVSGAGTQIGRVRLTDFILHTFSSDLDITIKSPAGTVVTLTTDNAGGNDNVFYGTLWDDKADPGNQVPYLVPLAASFMVTDTAYTNLVVKPTLTPEEALAAFNGENPNGVWTMTISDDASLDGGTLTSWALEITTTTCQMSNCAVNCNDNNVCTDDSCDPATGCVYTNNQASCNDGFACTVGDVCSGGSCAGTPVVCNDGNVCTNDACNPATGQCVYANNTNACDDGNTCTTNDTCAATSACGSTENFDGVFAPALPAGWSSTTTGLTLWVTQSTSSDTPPNSAFGFDGTAVADEVLVSPPISILSSTATLTFRNRWTFEGTTTCFDGGVLEIKIGAGSFTDIVTAGGSFVSGGYTAIVSSSFTNPLAGRSAWCLASTGYPAYLTTVVNLPAAAAGQTIQLRWRVGTDTSVGAAGQNIDSIAISDGCAAVCTGGAALDCNDNNPCTDDSCDPATGCVHTNNTSPCNDGNACTTNDTCGGGTCSGGPPPVCNDNNVCTTDTCDPATGCVFTNNTIPCSDGNACTTGDTCGGGVCNPGGPTNCDDGQCCTIDSCNPATGCVYTANTAPPVFTNQPSLGNTVLWPPQHGYADFTLASTGVSAASACGIASVQFASCSSSQPENGTGVGDGNTTRDCVYEPGALHLRAERDGACSPVGRVYSMQMVATDVCGNTTTSNSFDVAVWHDRGHQPTVGTIVSANPNSNTPDTRDGANGTYGASCGLGSSSANGTVRDDSDADPEMEITQNASISVGDLRIEKASGGNLKLTWTEPAHQAGINVTRFHVYRLDPVTLDWTQIAEVSKQTTSYQDPVLNDGVSHQYKITAMIK